MSREPAFLSFRSLPLAAAILVISSLVPGSFALAGGYLWLGAEFQGEGNIYRYNLQTNTIDLVTSPPSTDHWNNMATAAGRVYLGNPTSQVFNQHDAYTGALLTPGTHSATLGGHKEDGASFDGSLWRVTFSGGALHRMTTAGVLESTLTAPTGLVGLEFANGQGWATNYSTDRFGRLTRGAVWAFVPSVWAVGQAPTGNLGGLAYDAQSGTMYMATDAGNLYTVTSVNDTARATLVIDLNTVGYPTGGLPDGMGWVLHESAVGILPPAPKGGSVELGAPWPNPARDAVWFEVRMPRSGAAHVGIYDVSGRLLRGWDLPGLGGGNSRFNWDLRTSDGRRVGPGQYFVRIEALGERSVRSFTRLE